MKLTYTRYVMAIFPYKAEYKVLFCSILHSCCMQFESKDKQYIYEHKFIIGRPSTINVQFYSFQLSIVRPYAQLSPHPLRDG